MGLALVAMKAPPVTREYQAALLQLVRSSDQEIAQRKASLQRLMRNVFSQEIFPGTPTIKRVSAIG